MEAWHDFLVAQVGASAALGGLLFVGLSLNLEKILGFPGVPERAQITLVMILATLLLGSLLLVPRQEFFPLGIEALAVGIATVALGTRFGLRAIRASQPEFRGHLGFNLFLFEIATIPYVIGGALLFHAYASGNDTPVVVLALSIASVTYGALLGTYLLAARWPRAKGRDIVGAVAVTVVAMLVVVFARPLAAGGMAWLEPLARLAWPWYVPLGTLLAFGTGVLLSHLPAPRAAVEREPR